MSIAVGDPGDEMTVSVTAGIVALADGFRTEGRGIDLTGRDGARAFSKSAWTGKVGCDEECPTGFFPLRGSPPRDAPLDPPRVCPYACLFTGVSGIITFRSPLLKPMATALSPKKSKALGPAGHADARLGPSILGV